VEPVLVGVAVLVVLIGIIVISYNRFVAQMASMDATWANIESELQRRHDLVPNLVATVQGYARHEQAVFDRVTQARAQAIAARPTSVPIEQQARAEDVLTQQLSTLLAITEAYPQLRSDAAFRDLQRQLVETEDRIAAARRLYNLEVAAYERRRRAVPSNVIASTAGFTARPMFEISDPAAAHAPLAQP
jgi:LemA protein